MSRNTLGSSINNLQGDRRPVVELPSGTRRMVDSARIIPQTNLVEIRTVADLLDGGKVRTLRVPLNTPVMGFLPLPKPKAAPESPES
jgi:hypothetical protein